MQNLFFQNQKKRGGVGGHFLIRYCNNSCTDALLNKLTIPDICEGTYFVVFTRRSLIVLNFYYQKKKSLIFLKVEESLVLDPDCLALDYEPYHLNISPH